MRVLVVARGWPPDLSTGRTEAFARLVERLDGPCEIRAVVGFRADRSGLPPGALGVDLRAAGRLGGTVALWRATREVARGWRPDVVLTQGLSLPPVGVPVVAVVRDLIGTGWSRPASGPWLRLAARVAKGVVVPSAPVRRDLGRLGVDPWRVEVIPEVVALPEPPPLPPLEPLSLLVPGTIHPAKAQHLAIDAVSRLPRPLKERVRLTIAGVDGDPRYLAQLRVAARGQPVVFSVGPGAVAAALPASALLVYPSALPEGFPDAALRGMAAGRGVLFPDHGSLRDAVGAGGVPVPPNDPAALRDRIAEAVAGRLDVAALGARARAEIAARYGWERLWPRWRMVLARAAGRR